MTDPLDFYSSDISWFSLNFIMGWLHMRAIIRQYKHDLDDGVTSEEQCFYLVFCGLFLARLFMTIFVNFRNNERKVEGGFADKTWLWYPLWLIFGVSWLLQWFVTYEHFA